jgi:hypothetical protein
MSKEYYLECISGWNFRIMQLEEDIAILNRNLERYRNIRDGLIRELKENHE